MLAFPGISITVDWFCLSQSFPNFVRNVSSFVLLSILFVRVTYVVACIRSFSFSLLTTILSYDYTTIC